MVYLRAVSRVDAGVSRSGAGASEPYARTGIGERHGRTERGRERFKKDQLLYNVGLIC